MSKNIYNVWNKWGKLNAVCLGSMFEPGYFDVIADVEVRNQLNDLLAETLEDFNHYEKVLKDFGAEVIRPDVTGRRWEERIRYTESGEEVIRGLPKPPLTPRDAQVVLGNKLFLTDPGVSPDIRKVLMDWNSEDVVNAEFGPPHPETGKPFGYAAAHMTLIGRDLYLDHTPDTTDIMRAKMYDQSRPDLVAAIRKEHPYLRIHALSIGGHNDGAYSPIVPGAILTMSDIQRYHNTFPGWDLYKFDRPSWTQDMNYTKARVNEHWWHPAKDHIPALRYFVDTWLNDWIGDMSETIFDVNVFALDEKTVIVNDVDSPEIRRFAREKKVELVHVPWRHRYFWDGGLHCMTLELNRDGEMVDYFPERGDDTSLYDEGYDIPDEFLHMHKPIR